MKAAFRRIFVATLACLSGHAMAQAPAGVTPAAGEGWAFKLPAKQVVRFKGAQALEGAESAGQQIMYVGAGAAGALAQLIAHGLVMSAVRSKEASDAEKAADQVLTPHRDVLEGFTHEELYALAEPELRLGRARTIPAEHTPDASEWLHASDSVFRLAQDQGAIVLDSAFAVYSPDSPAKPVLQSTVRVVSSPLDAEQPEAHWKSENGAKLKTFSAHLFAHAVLLSRAEAAAIIAGESVEKRPFKSVRYIMGKTERVERAQVLDEACGRLLLRTLRGGLLSVPVKTQPGASEAILACPPEKTWIALADPQAKGR